MATFAPWIEMCPGVRRRTLASGSGMMQMTVTFAAGAKLPEHRHPHEQITHVVRGCLRLILHGGAEIHELKPGESFYLTSEIPHGAEALEETSVVDTFNPPREDLLSQDQQAT